MKCLSALALALLLPLAVPAAPATNRLINAEFRDATLRDVAEFVSEKSGLKLLVAENYAEMTVTLDMAQATPEDVLAAVGARLACEGINVGWKESPLTDGQKAYVVAEVPPLVSKPLADCAKSFKGAARVTMQFRQAQLGDVASYLQKLMGGSLTLVHGGGLAEVPVDLKLKDVTPLDALLALNELFKSAGQTVAWRGVTLPSGRMLFALLDTAPATAPQAGIEGTPRVYFIGDLGPDPAVTVEAVHQLLGGTQLRAEINLHEETRMLVVRGNDEVHAFVKNVVEELRRGAAAKPAPAPEAKP